MTIRMATPTDAEGVALVRVRSWQAAYEGLYPQGHLDAMSVEDEEERQRRWLSEKRALPLVIEFEGRIAGFAVLARQATEERNGPAGELHGIYLHPDYWRRGLGTLLWQRIEKESWGAGWSWLFLRVFSENYRARRFYEAMGCVPDCSSIRVQTFDGHELETMRYWRDLSSKATQDSSS